MSVRTALSRTARKAEELATRKSTAMNSNRDCVQLRGLSPSAMPQDVWRMIHHANIENVIDVKLDYNRFIPQGRAYAILSHHRFLESTLPIFRRLTFASSRIFAIPCHSPDKVVHRTRGKRGRAEAEARGVLNGVGAAAGIYVQGCDVMITGMPRGTTKDLVARYLKNNKLVGELEDGNADCEVLKVTTYDQATTNERYLVRVKAAAEAHAIARRLHMTYCKPWDGGGSGPTLVQARVLY